MAKPPPRRLQLKVVLAASFALLLAGLLGGLYAYIPWRVGTFLQARLVARGEAKAREVAATLTAAAAGVARPTAPATRGGQGAEAPGAGGQGPGGQGAGGGAAALAPGASAQPAQVLDAALAGERAEFVFLALLGPDGSLQARSQPRVSPASGWAAAADTEAFLREALERVRERGVPGPVRVGPERLAVLYASEGSPTRVLVGMDLSQEDAVLDDIRGALAVAALVGLVLFLFLLWLIGRRFLLTPLADMQAMARRLSDSDLTGRLEGGSTEELGALADALNRIGQGLRDTLGRVRGVSEGVAGVIEQLGRTGTSVSAGAGTIQVRVEETSSSMAEMLASLRGIAESVEVLYRSAEESSSSILEMAATNDEVARSVQAMAASVEETTSAIEQMTSSIKEVAHSIEQLHMTAEETSQSVNRMDASIGQVEANADETAKLSEQVQADAETGVEALSKTLAGIDRIKESSRTASGVIESLGRRIEEIGNILTVIDEVAEQTNLLALNAAIIAAQAGEHGKGFAVVAEEIKDLAERTGASTQEIADLVRGVQEASRQAVGVMNQGVRNVEEGVQLGREAEQALRKIYDSAQKSTQRVKAIAHATLEQSRGSKQVAGAMNRIAGAVQHISRATSEQAKGGEQIIQGAERMKALTLVVQRSAQEQAQGGRQITRSIERVNEMVTHLNRAQKEQTLGSEQVMHAVDSIKAVSEQQLKSVRQLEQAIEALGRQAEVLRGEVRRFRM